MFFPNAFFETPARDGMNGAAIIFTRKMENWLRAAGLPHPEKRRKTTSPGGMMIRGSWQNQFLMRIDIQNSIT